MITRKKINRKVPDKTQPQNFRIVMFLLVHEVDKQWPFSTIQSCVMLKYRKSFCIKKDNNLIAISCKFIVSTTTYADFFAITG
jgi:hypothetical protein